MVVMGEITERFGYSSATSCFENGLDLPQDESNTLGMNKGCVPFALLVRLKSDMSDIGKIECCFNGF